MIPISSPYIDNKAKKYVLKCLNTNWISSQGEYIVKFEKVSENLYKSIVEKDNELQIGTYKLIDKKYIAHGNWRLYKNNKQGLLIRR